jgi:hypothetical protein
MSVRPLLASRMARTGAITYSALSMSATGLRGLGVRTYVDAWRAIEHFTVQCAGTPDPKLLRCDLKKPPKRLPLFDKHYRQLKGILGAPVAGHGSGQTEYNWLLARSGFEDALAYADMLRADPSRGLEAARFRFHCDYDFLLWDPDASAFLPFQGADEYVHFEADYERLLGQSYLRVSLGPGYAMNVFLTFPFEEPDETFARYARIVDEHFPVRLSMKHWKHWHLNKRGDRYVGRKFQPRG